jgi:cytochrome c oxidase cbb3-type subunit III
MAAPETDRITGVETTGHDWDGIKELNNPLPRWWLWTFYASIVWALGYMVVYPAWPLVTEATAGLLGWSSRAELHAELADAQVGQDKFRARLAVLSPAEIRQDAELYPVAVAGGRSAFLVNCVQCHGSGAQGFKGFPNLADVATVVRSKNAGPGTLALDLFFASEADFKAAVAAPGLSPAAIAGLYGVPARRR